MTKREQILSAILIILKGISGVNPDHVVRSRAFPYNEKSLPFISISPRIEQRNEAVMTNIDSILSVKISLWANGDVPDQVADSIVSQIDSLMMADRTLGGLAMDLRPVDVSFEFDEGNKPEVQVDLDYLIQFRTILT